jgi:hypothetical protein
MNFHSCDFQDHKWVKANSLPTTKANQKFLYIRANCKSPSASFRRKPESSLFSAFWTPAFAGVTEYAGFAIGSSNNNS